MRKVILSSLCSIPFAFTAVGSAYAQDAVQDVNNISVKEHILDQNVYNDDDENIGDIRDVILTPENEVSDYIIGVGGFLGLGEHNVAISIDEFEYDDDKFYLRNVTEDDLKEMPKAEIAASSTGLMSDAHAGTVNDDSAPETAPANKETLKGNWNELKGKAKEKWGKLTDDDIKVIEGQRDQLIGKLQQREGLAKAQAEKEVREWEQENDAQWSRK